MLAPVAQEFGVNVTEVDIISDENLERLYETRIPVVSLNNNELNWPFTMAEVRRLFLDQMPQKN